MDTAIAVTIGFFLAVVALRRLRGVRLPPPGRSGARADPAQPGVAPYGRRVAALLAVVRASLGFGALAGCSKDPSIRSLSSS